MGCTSGLYTMQLRLVTSLLIAVTGGLSSLVAQDLSFEKSVAADSLKRDNYDEAIVIYTKVVARNRRDASAYYDRGVIHLMKGDFQNAIADLTHALQLDPTKVAHYSALAIAYAEEGTKTNRPDDCDKAMAISNEALQHDAWFFSAYGARGWGYVCKAEVTENVSFLDAAIADFTIFIKTTPRNVRAYWGRGRAYRDKGEYDRAIADANQALWLRPQSGMTYNERGMSYTSKGDYDNAITDFTKSIELGNATQSPKDLANFYYNRGTAYNAKEKYNEAILDFTKAISLDPTKIPFYGNRAIAYFQTRNFKAGLADLNHALQRDPGAPRNYNDLAWFLATCPDASFRNGARDPVRNQSM
jgi:tetratricopeptide (TPR) repeat protein